MSKRDVSRTDKRDASVHLVGGLAAGMDSYVTGMERQGTEELARSTQLPREGFTRDIDGLPYEGPGGRHPRAVELGIELAPDPGDDPLFVRVILPEGFQQRTTEHSMWNDLYGPGGKVASIFYKAAFYDRRALMHWERRYAVADQEDADGLWDLRDRAKAGIVLSRHQSQDEAWERARELSNPDETWEEA